ncbi:restriction endonuclease subunit S [Aquimarina sp. AU119]|uniref:restriction endonuclease subunit S n=1 Tax=Aquimarina sp. AU119 TaxID=2108528 RepID=UPI000D69B611|nr:restriction endonuclease subunit S [Aquimarina sp. AU119]
MANQKNIPHLRFPEFNKDWNDDTMGNTYSFKVTNSFSRDNLTNDDGEVKNIHYGDIHKKFPTLIDLTKESVPFIKPTISIERISKENYCKDGDMIFADASEDINDVGKAIEIININNEKLLSGLHTILARPDLQKLSIGFGGYLYQSEFVRTQIQKESQGTKVLSISPTRLSKISLKFPSDKEEQSKIAYFFSTIDEKIKALKNKKELLEEYKKGVAQKLFSQETRFKDKNGKDFPDWENTKLGKITNKTGKKNKDNIDYPVYSINNKEGFLPQSDQFEGVNSNNRGYDISMYKIIQKNTFAYNPARINVGSIGYSGELENIIISSLYVCFQTTDELEDEYLNHYLQTFDFNKSVQRNTEGGVRSYLFYENFSRIEIPLPLEKDEQAKIAGILSSIDKKIGLIDEKLNDTEQWKKGLLQKMFC